MDREAWRAAIHGVAKSWTWLSDWTELNWTEHHHQVKWPLQASREMCRGWCIWFRKSWEQPELEICGLEWVVYTDANWTFGCSQDHPERQQRVREQEHMADVRSFHDFSTESLCFKQISLASDSHISFTASWLYPGNSLSAIFRKHLLRGRHRIVNQAWASDLKSWAWPGVGKSQLLYS